MYGGDGSFDVERGVALIYPGDDIISVDCELELYKGEQILRNPAAKEVEQRCREDGGLGNSAEIGERSILFGS